MSQTNGQYPAVWCKVVVLFALVLLSIGALGLPASSAQGHSNLAGTATAVNGKTGRIAFETDRDGNSEIYAMDADGTNVVNLTNNGADDKQPAWSPDGTQIAFQSDRDGNLEIFLMNADGSNQHNLTANQGENSAPAWSPDGKQIAYVFGPLEEWQIYVIDVDGKNAHVISDEDSFGQRPAWSPDGKHILFQSFSQIYIMDTDGRNKRNLTKNNADNVDPVWSPDGKRIAFASNSDDPDGALQIYVMDADGKNRHRLTDEKTNQGWPAWSPDGTQIAFTSGYSCCPELFLIDADGSNLRKLGYTGTSAYGDQNPTWQYVPTRLVAPATPTPASPTKLYKLAFSADYYDPDEQSDAPLSADAITTVDSDGKNEEILTAITRGSSSSRPTWSPDGTQIAFLGGDQIFVMNADGSGQRNLSNSTEREDDPVWSPDGKHIAFVSTRDDNDEIYVMDADGSNQRRLTDQKFSDIHPRWSPDSQWIVYTGTGRSGPIVNIVDADGKNGRTLAKNGFDAVWSPDGKHIAFVSTQDHHDVIYLVKPDGSGLRRLFLQEGVAGDPAWSPDSKQIAFSGALKLDTGQNDQLYQNDQIYVVDIETGKPYRLTNMDTNRFPAWSPDGKQIAFVKESRSTSGYGKEIAFIKQRSSGFSDLFGASQIYVIDAVGKNQHRVSHAIGQFIGDPVWRPIPNPGP